MMQSSVLLPIEFDLAATFLMATTGVSAASRRGYDAVGAFSMAFVAGVGGGMLRDFLTREAPLMFKPGQLYALAAFAGCIVFLALQSGYHAPVQDAAWIAIAATLLLRVLAIRFNWTARPFSCRDEWVRRRRSES